jgi:predicted site-specific integrase-resolvase
MHQNDEYLERLERMEQLLLVLLNRSSIKDWYTTEEFARVVEKAEFTVREWCRLGRIHAEKRNSGRGRFQSWVVSHVELQRYQREGLLPPARSASSS